MHRLPRTTLYRYSSLTLGLNTAGFVPTPSFPSLWFVCPLCLCVVLSPQADSDDEGLPDLEDDDEPQPDA